ncbi:MAG: HAMP domain-containing histidine kinase [Bacteroidales bacterium]|nr:HAMP domain-containing histidine kinase [Bacteroidales bacterium]
MIKLKIKLALFNLLSKLAFTALFLLVMSYIIERINLRQVDNNLIQKREKVLELIGNIGIEPFMTSDTTDAFGSYNILKEEFISLEKTDTTADLNFIEETSRIIEGDEIAYRVLNYSFMVDGQKYLLDIGNSLTSIMQEKKNTTRVILVFLVLIILITFLTDLQYNHYLLRPLDRITNKLKGISNPALFDKTPVRTNTSDFYSLDHALRELMDNINELFQKEKEITINISHELLTPVSVLRSKLENLLMKTDIEPEISEKIEESLKTLHRLQSLVNSLLLIARIESRQYLREETVDMNEIMREILNELSPVAEDKSVNLREDYIDNYQFKDANRSLIFSMLYNVVNNAVKFTNTGGEITAKSVLRHGRFVITISDTGKGMSPAQMNSLFSRFKSKIITDENSTGIGLAITKSIADFHNIEVSVVSEPAKGTTFSFFFPENS